MHSKMTAKRDAFYLSVTFATTLRLGFLLFSLIGFSYDGVHHSLISLPTLFCQVLIGCIVFSTVVIVFQHKGCLKISIKTQMQGMLQLSVLIALGTGLCHVVLVLFGAALTSVVWETLHVACLLVVTVILPSAFLAWPNVSDGVLSLLLDSEDSVVSRTLRISSLCSIVGCWLGAIPIPLDWDRPWQEWPITCVVGTFAGSTVGLPVGYAYATYLQRQADKLKLG